MTEELCIYCGTGNERHSGYERTCPWPCRCTRVFTPGPTYEELQARVKELEQALPKCQMPDCPQLATREWWVEDYFITRRCGDPGHGYVAKDDDAERVDLPWAHLVRKGTDR